MRYLLVLIVLGGCFKPLQGTWTTSGGEITETTCVERDQHPVRDGATLTLVSLDKGAFRLRIEGDAAYGCETSGKSFTCGTHRDDVDASDDGSAVLHLSTSFDGVFLGDSSMTAHRYVDISCEGETCDDVASAQGRTFPCSTAAGFDAVLTDYAIDTPNGNDTDVADAG